MTQKLEGLLMDPEYAGLVEMALALSDAENRQQISDLTLFAALPRAPAKPLQDKLSPQPRNLTPQRISPLP